MIKAPNGETEIVARIRNSGKKVGVLQVRMNR